jgi:hypothetical protein
MNQPSAVRQNDPHVAAGYSYQHQGQPTYANHARPPASTIPYATHPGYQPQYQPQTGGVAPGQISSNPGGSRSGMLAHTGPGQQPQYVFPSIVCLVRTVLNASSSIESTAKAAPL